MIYPSRLNRTVYIQGTTVVTPGRTQEGLCGGDDGTGLVVQ